MKNELIFEPFDYQQDITFYHGTDNLYI